MGPNVIKDIAVSIIIVNYNSSQLLDTCLYSITEYTKNLEYEIIVVDNASTEGNIEHIISKFPYTRLLRNEENLGFAKANNLGLEPATGEYILFLNNDTYLIENTIKKTYDFAKKLGEEVFIGCKLLNNDGTYQTSIVDFDTLSNSFGENFFLYKLFPKSKIFNRYHFSYKNINTPIEVDIIKGAFMFCSAKAIKRLGGFDHRFFFYGEESDICMRFKKQGGKIFYYPGTSIYHVGGATVEKKQWFKFKHQNLSKIKKYQKHYYSFEFIMLILFHFSGLIIRIPVYFISGLFLFNKSRFLQGFYYFKSLFIYPKNDFQNRYKR